MSDKPKFTLEQIRAMTLPEFIELVTGRHLTTTQRGLIDVMKLWEEEGKDVPFMVSRASHRDSMRTLHHHRKTFSFIKEQIQ